MDRGQPTVPRNNPDHLLDLLLVVVVLLMCVFVPPDYIAPALRHTRSDAGDRLLLRCMEQLDEGDTFYSLLQTMITRNRDSHAHLEVAVVCSDTREKMA